MDVAMSDLTLVPVIVALVRVFRMAGLPSRWLPLCAIALGIAGGYLYIAPEDPKLGLLSGIIMGLTAIGAWSGVKNTLH